MKRTKIKERCLLGAIAGDIIGSPYEGVKLRKKDFDLFTERSVFTDDTVLTAAVADSILNGNKITGNLKNFYRAYPNAGFGGMFQNWASSDNDEPYNSFGNGSAMRVSPVGWAFDDLNEVLYHAERTAAVTHNHPEGIKGAQAIASLVYLARRGHSKDKMADYIQDKFEYDIDFDLDDLINNYAADVTCQGSVPIAVFLFLVSKNFEDTMRNAVAVGGDTDTIACMAGAAAEAFYNEVPEVIKRETLKRLDDRLKNIFHQFREEYMK